ncbi:flavin-containing monooxygenase YUCCA2-like protein [Corchorus olitorius]|uniref:Flavin-containing monooxygenase YUCCA2-like protein n=1 Tax=Corchorus olitorius TaxID=93759 RepID=A0A1R3HW01_9ROSI|nr:flavin-containing monooxygenase YUCCA2-like protein [Corchorus olitorius]
MSRLKTLASLNSAATIDSLSLHHRRQLKPPPMEPNPTD